ncbi:MAG: D-sedoheptulose 7-phosphate isomerase [Planctomycetota bacterium]
MLDYVQNHFQTSAQVKQAFVAEHADAVVKAAEMGAAALKAGGKIMFCGNGGSAADSQHLAAEFVSVLNQDFFREALPALALTTDSSFLTANANDYGFEGVFARQVAGLGRKDDLLVGISTSGNSKNVVKAFQEAKQKSIKTIGFTGQGGGAMAEIADHMITVPSNQVQYIQECHIAVGHVFVALIEKILYPEQ